ncbi:MAG TPA: Na+/H+ antiporter NhaC [Flavobacteriales bacterium]|nr:Na+/H+ antiporter NhaC [Flavobacteriales bacterium]
MTSEKKPSLLQSFIPLIFLVSLLGMNVAFYGDDSLGGANQMALLFSAGVAGVVAMVLGQKWDTLFDGVISSIGSALPALIILLMIGALAGTWLISGVVPAMIYYGLEILNPTIFLFATCIICSIVSVATGSSWTTVATVGVALMGIGRILGFGDGMIAGAIISGSYFGDKMSPLSDTTNLAPAMAGTDLFTHIKHMMWTTFPSITIAALMFLVLGFTSGSGADVEGVESLQAAIASKFNISLGLFLVPVAVIALIVKKVPAAPALLIGALIGGITAIAFQPQIIESLATEGVGYGQAAYMAMIDAMTTDVAIVTGDAAADDLLSSGGMNGMLGTIWLIICAMIFGGIMEASGMLERIAQTILHLAKSTGSLIASTAGTCMVFNVTASDQYLAIVVPGRMFAKEYEKRGLAGENLSRTLEDSGTVTSALVPWNTCGAYHAGVLGVATGTYLPFAFFNIISPIMTIFYGYMGWKITKLVKKD